MPHALHFLVLALAGWVNRHQEDRIDYLREENRVLREHLGPRPLRLTDAQRRRLAVLTLAGLRRYFVFFVIELKTRRVHIAGIHPQPDGRVAGADGPQSDRSGRRLPADRAPADS